MRIFVGEYVCGGGLLQHSIDTLPITLRREGFAMMSALVEDLAEFADIVLPIDQRIALNQFGMNRSKVEFLSSDQVEYRPLANAKFFLEEWLAAASTCDTAIIIAPETDSTLRHLLQAFRTQSIPVFAPTDEFVRIASDKLLTAERLLSANVPHPPTWIRPQIENPEGTSQKVIDSSVAKFLLHGDSGGSVVIKPRDGCGSEGIHIISRDALASREISDQEILQSQVHGMSISASIIATPNGIDFLPAVTQELDPESHEYLGGKGPLNPEYQQRARQLVEKVIDAMPTLTAGYVGIDLLLGQTPKEDVVIEINPRLTTSYVGLRKMVDGNLAKRFFNLESSSINYDSVEHSVAWESGGHTRKQTRR
ncbi:MAG: ATP-grasp domain-containing protein [Rubripirellula sp.]